MPALLADRLRATEALRRSWALARPRLGWVLLVGLWVLLGWLVVLLPVFAMVLLDAGDHATGVVGELLVSAAQMASATTYVYAYVLCRAGERSVA